MEVVQQQEKVSLEVAHQKAGGSPSAPQVPAPAAEWAAPPAGELAVVWAGEGVVLLPLRAGEVVAAPLLQAVGLVVLAELVEGRQLGLCAGEVLMGRSAEEGLREQHAVGVPHL